MSEPMDTVMSTSTQDETNSSPESRPKRNLRQTTLLDYRSQTDRSPPLPIAPQPSLNNGVVATNAIASPADGAADSEASDLDNAPQPPHKKRKLRSATRSEAVESGEKDSTALSLKTTLHLPPAILSQLAVDTNHVANFVQPGIQQTINQLQKVRGNSKPTKPATTPVTKASKVFQAPIVDNRSLPWGDPQVWSENRADLCESLPYFNSYQGSSYTKNGTVRAKLLDHDCGERQYMDEEIVITRAGGGIGEADKSGEKLQVKDQQGGKSEIVSFRANMERGIPLILIVGSKNIYCPSKIPYRYCVLGTFQVTDIWAEKSNQCIVWKFRLEKIDLDCKSWWAAEESGPSPKSQSLAQVKASLKECRECHTTSKQIYQQGWMCLNEKCKLHWTLNGKKPAGDLDFHEGFKMERTAFVGFMPPHSLIPRLPNASTSQTVTRQCWKGFVCPKCGRCNQRTEWAGWQCLSEDCDYELVPPLEIVPASIFMGELSSHFQGHALSDDDFNSTQVRCMRSTHGFYSVHDYILPFGIRVTHGHSNAVINMQSGGPDDVFRGLQEAKIGLRRLPVQSPTSGTRSAHFSKNYGLPYKYHVNQPDSTSFADAPPEVREAIRRMTWVARRVADTTSEEIFNECLAVGYLAEGKMGYHDDGESTLGPDIAAWSLGCPAEFNIRMKYKYYSGFTTKGSYDPSLPVVPGCFAPEKRHELNGLKDKMSSEALTAKAKKLLKGCQRQPPDIIKMKLRHGDFVSMHGSPMQLYYEHACVGGNGLRFALTCRKIKLNMIKKELHSKGDLYIDPANAYDGDLQAFEDWKKENDALKDAASLRRRGATSTVITA